MTAHDQEFEHTAAPSTVGRDFNPFFGPQFENPYTFYARARDEEPVFFSELLQMWYVTRYDDIVAVARDPIRFSSTEAVNAPVAYTLESQRAIDDSWLSHGAMTNNDPPSHTKVRRVFNKAFSLRARTDLESLIRAIANDLIDQFVDEGRAEFVSRFCAPLPLRAILRILGAPEADQTMLKQWSDDWIALILAQLTPDQQAETVGRLLEAGLYWTELIDDRTKCPRDDLLSDLILASNEEQDPIELPQMINLCSTLVLAGHETTMNFLGLMVYRMLSNPDQWQQVRDNPAYISKAVEETLRADSPVHMLMRTTTEPVVLGGIPLPTGAQLALLFAAGNHDEKYFPEAATFDIHRERTKSHLTFGHGIHHCVGASLARLEGGIVLELLLKRFTGLRLSLQEVTWVVNPVHRGLKELWIDWDA